MVRYLASTGDTNGKILSINTNGITSTGRY